MSKNLRIFNIKRIGLFIVILFMCFILSACDSSHKPDYEKYTLIACYQYDINTGFSSNKRQKTNFTEITAYFKCGCEDGYYNEGNDQYFYVFRYESEEEKITHLMYYQFYMWKCLQIDDVEKASKKSFYIDYISAMQQQSYVRSYSPDEINKLFL